MIKKILKRLGYNLVKISKEPPNTKLQGEGESLVLSYSGESVEMKGSNRLFYKDENGEFLPLYFF